MEKLLKALYRIVMHKEAEGELNFEFDGRWKIFLVFVLLLVAMVVYAFVRIAASWTSVVIAFVCLAAGLWVLARIRRQEAERKDS